ncbi:MAG TPA: hypothetical protein VF972_04695, partial [Actinomycetota bacterium]
MALGGAVAWAATSSTGVSLPAVPPDRLVSSVLHAGLSRSPIAGRVDAWANLGLPDLAGDGYAPEGSVLAGLTGVHHLRVWESRDGLRLTEVLPTNERSIFVSHVTRQGWAWDSSTFTAYRLPLPEAPAGEPPAARAAGPAEYPDPVALSRYLLSAAGPTTAVRVDGTIRVAGRAAYHLVIEPRTPRTLIGRIDIGIDAQHRVPLSVSITPRSGGQPAMWARFTSVDFGPVDPSVYRFSPPRGARVETARPGVAPAIGGPLGIQAGLT